VNDPAAGTTDFTHAVVSLVAQIARTSEAVVQSEQVTTSDDAPDAKFTLPAALFMVCAPVVPAAVLVLSGQSVRSFKSRNVPAVPLLICITPAEDLLMAVSRFVRIVDSVPDVELDQPINQPLPMTCFIWFAPSTR